jgi:endonuclease III
LDCNLNPPLAVCECFDRDHESSPLSSGFVLLLLRVRSRLFIHSVTLPTERLTRIGGMAFLTRERFEIEHALIKVQALCKGWAKPVAAHYSETPFTVLISCLLSLRTQDKTTDAASERLFRLAEKPETMAALPLAPIRKAIYPVGFYNTKAKCIQEICRILLAEYGGKVPDSIEALVKLPGVGRKTANLVVTLGFGQPGICVDTHVHRITNRWGYVRTRSPEETEMALRRKLPAKYWIDLNEWLVMFGQNQCKPISPHCSTCPLRPQCPRRGVTTSR